MEKSLATYITDKRSKEVIVCLAKHSKKWVEGMSWQFTGKEIQAKRLFKKNFQPH